MQMCGLFIEPKLLLPLKQLKSAREGCLTVPLASSWGQTVTRWGGLKRLETSICLGDVTFLSDWNLMNIVCVLNLLDIDYASLILRIPWEYSKKRSSN